MTSASPENGDQSGPLAPGFSPGWPAALVATVIVTILFAELPSRFRLLALYYPFQGICLGAMFALLEKNSPMLTTPIVRKFLVALLTTASILLGSWQGFRQYHRANDQPVEAGERMLRQMLDSVEQTDAAFESFRELTRQNLAELERDRIRRASFSGYLANRWQSIASLRSPWPEILWLLEVLVANCLAILVSGHRFF